MNRASIENKGDSRFYATTKDYAFVLDTEGQGANPIDALLASLCACIGHMTRDYLKSNGDASRGFRVTAEGSMTADETKLSVIRLGIDINGTGLDNARESELLAHVERCKIRQTLKDACDVQIELQH